MCLSQNENENENVLAQDKTQKLLICVCNSGQKQAKTHSKILNSRSQFQTWSFQNLFRLFRRNQGLDIVPKCIKIKHYASQFPNSANYFLPISNELRSSSSPEVVRREAIKCGNKIKRGFLNFKEQLIPSISKSIYILITGVL